MSDELKDQRVVTMMSPSELKTIDDWSFGNRIRSRGEAIRRLCQIGVAVDADAGDLRQKMMTLIDAYAIEKGVVNADDGTFEDLRQGIDLNERGRLKGLNRTDLTTEIIVMMTELEGRLRDLAQTAHMLRHKDFNPADAKDRLDFIEAKRERDNAYLAYIKSEMTKPKNGAD